MSSPCTDPGDTPKKGRRKKGEKIAIPEMTPKWLRKENLKAIQLKLTDLNIDKGKERGQIRLINYDDLARNVGGYQSPPPPVIGTTCPETFSRKKSLQCLSWRA